jgi:hypothetical protein
MTQQKQKQHESKESFEVEQRKLLPRRLPLEMECEIFKCLKWQIQRTFIWGLGKGIHAMFRQKVLSKVY